MTDMAARTPTPSTRRRTIGALGVAAACIGCCSLPFIASASIAGVAICSTRFLGVAFGAVFAVAATAALVVYRKRKRQPPTSVPVEFGPLRAHAEKS